MLQPSIDFPSHKVGTLTDVCFPLMIARKSSGLVGSLADVIETSITTTPLQKNRYNYRKTFQEKRNTEPNMSDQKRMLSNEAKRKSLPIRFKYHESYTFYDSATITGGGLGSIRIYDREEI